jgi:hypothetical protein
MKLNWKVLREILDNTLEDGKNIVIACEKDVASIVVDYLDEYDMTGHFPSIITPTLIEPELHDKNIIIITTNGGYDYYVKSISVVQDQVCDELYAIGDFGLEELSTVSSPIKMFFERLIVNESDLIPEDDYDEYECHCECCSREDVDCDYDCCDCEDDDCNCDCDCDECEPLKIFDWEKISKEQPDEETVLGYKLIEAYYTMILNVDTTERIIGILCDMADDFEQLGANKILKR